MPAKLVNDDAFQQDKRGAFECFAGKPAPTLTVCELLFISCTQSPTTNKVERVTPGMLYTFKVFFDRMTFPSLRGFP